MEQEETNCALCCCEMLCDDVERCSVCGTDGICYDCLLEHDCDDESV